MDVGMHRDFRVFFESESDALLRLCWAVTLDREQARDVAQETMTRAWREWDRLGRPRASDGAQEDPPSPAAWCRTVALNLIRSQWRRERTARTAQLPPPEPVGLGATDLDVRDALEQLSTRQREAVVLHHMLDLSVLQCAEIMGLGEPSVKTHLQRGRDALHKQLANHLIETREV